MSKYDEVFSSIIEKESEFVILKKKFFLLKRFSLFFINISNSKEFIVPYTSCKGWPILRGKYILFEINSVI